jgi:AraC-like DNA-binding protein
VESQRILVIDDDPALLESLAAALVPPYCVLTALDGPAALALLAATRVDLVLLDLCLRGADGAALIPEIRRASPAPILLMTGHATHDNLVRGIRARPDDFLEKPFSLEELRRQMTAILGVPRPAPDRVEAIRQRIDREYAHRLTLAVLARQAGMSPPELRTAFQRRYGMTPHAYLVECRMRQAARLLAGAGEIKRVSGEVGYASPSNFSIAFKRMRGLSPSCFRAQAAQGDGSGERGS